MIKKLVGAAVGLGILGGAIIFFHLFVNNKLGIGYNKGYQPTQPLPFSHKFHAGELRVDCKYCHSTAEVSRHSAVPSLNICMNCHLNINTQSEALTHLKKAYNEGQSIAWNKVYLLPDYVKFNHAPHIKAGKECQICHGPVETMEKVYQYVDLSMGWCVNCHREQMNKREKYAQAHISKNSTRTHSQRFQSSDSPHPSPEELGVNPQWQSSLINCSTCHY